MTPALLVFFVIGTIAVALLILSRVSGEGSPARRGSFAPLRIKDQRS